MRLQVRSENTTIFYPLAAWSWESETRLLIQRIPKITEVLFHIPGKTKTPKIEIPQHLLQPSLQIGQQVRLDDAIYYIANIEPLPPDGYDGTIFVYYMSEIAPKVPAFWSVDVIEEPTKHAACPKCGNQHMVYDTNCDPIYYCSKCDITFEAAEVVYTSLPCPCQSCISKYSDKKT